MDAWQALSMGAVGFCVCLILIGLIYFPRSPMTRPLLGVATCAALWAAGDVITWHPRDLITEQIGIAVLYSGSIFLPPLWWLLVLRWAAARGAPLPRGAQRLWWLSVAWAGGMWLLMLANPWHQLLLLPIVGDRNVLLPLWWALAIPEYSLVLCAVGVQLWVVRRASGTGARPEAAMMIGASLTVLVANWLYVLWVEPPPVDGVVLVFAASGALLFAGLRVEEERRQFAERLSREVETRTRQLDYSNRDLHSANRRLRELQEQLLRAERLAAEEYLAGSIAHSINNPLTILKGRIEMALEARKVDKLTLQELLELTRRVGAVVDGTLGLVRRRSLNLSVEAPAVVLEEVREELAERAAERGAAIDLKASPNLPGIVIDRSLLVTALVAIVENAIDATEKHGGHVWLEAEENATIGVPAMAFRIADSGPGVPVHLRSKVFEPFFTTKRSGTGLGLAVARGVIKGHAGQLRIDDRPGGGTLVTVDIPLRPLGVALSNHGAT